MHICVCPGGCLAPPSCMTRRTRMTWLTVCALPVQVLHDMDVIAEGRVRALSPPGAGASAAKGTAAAPSGESTSCSYCQAPTGCLRLLQLGSQCAEQVSQHVVWRVRTAPGLPPCQVLPGRMRCHAEQRSNDGCFHASRRA